jgi:probable F420-dependent oxidoreductase
MAARRLGISVPLPGIPLAEHRDWLREIVDLGYTDAWSQETAGLDAFTPLAVAAAWAAELRLGTAIASVFTRGPALLAQSAAALAEAAPGRFVLGLGVSSEAIVCGWNAMRFEAPYARMRDSLRFLRRALAGERIDEAFETFAVRGFALERVPEVPPPIYVAALQRDMLRLAGREGDGVLFSLVAASDVPAMAAAVGADREIAMRIGVLPGGDPGRAREGCRRLLAAYLNVPAYAAMHADLGRGDEIAPVRAAWQRGDRRAAVARVPDALVDALFVQGEPAACRERIEAFREAGVAAPILSILPFGGGPGDLRAAIRALAPR